MMLAHNDDHPVRCEAALAHIGDMDIVELQRVIAAACGALTSRMGAAHTGKIVSNVMAKLRPPERVLSLPEIAFHVAQKYDIEVADLRRPSRESRSSEDWVVKPRQEAFWLARQQRYRDGGWPHSMPCIGRYFGGRDHTTVLHGVRQHETRMAREVIQ